MADISERSRLDLIRNIVMSAESCSTPNIRAKSIFLKKKLVEFESLPRAGDQATKLWTKVLNQKQFDFVNLLCDLIIPADEFGPRASDVFVPEFIDEWFSIPSSDQTEDLAGLLKFFAQLDQISLQIHQQEFSLVTSVQQKQVLDHIMRLRKTDCRLLFTFFVYFRKLAGVAYFTTPAGEEAIGYVRDEASKSVYVGPPAEVLEKLGFKNVDR